MKHDRAHLAVAAVAAEEEAAEAAVDTVEDVAATAAIVVIAADVTNHQRDRSIETMRRGQAAMLVLFSSVGVVDLRMEARSTRLITFVLWLAWAWIAMTLSHELGHVFFGLLGGARLIQLELRPWHLPYSLLANDSHPLATLWAGPILGCVVPLIAATIARRPACWFVAWFCMLANASYLLLAYLSGDGELDSIKMIAAGSRPLEILGAVALSLPIGYIQFRRSCRDLLSGQTPPMSPRGLRASAAALLVVLGIQTAVGTLIVSVALKPAL